MTTTQTPETQRYSLHASLDAIASAARYVEREWGEYGYSVVEVSGGPTFKSAILQICHSDGSRFFVGSDRYGNCAYAETLDALHVTMSARDDD